MTARHRYEQWLHRHAAVFIGIALPATITLYWLGTGSTFHHLVLLMVMLPLLGIPHGALDDKLGKDVFSRRYPRSWRLLLFTVYLGMMGVVIAIWNAFPTASLAAFLVLTGYHFGLGDSLRSAHTPAAVRVTEMVSRGGMVLGLRAVFHRPEVTTIFQYLVPKPGAILLLDILTALVPLFMFCLLFCLFSSMMAYARCRSSLDLMRAAELATIALLFMTMPALLAFCIYFIGLHSIRHLLCVAAGSGESAMVPGILRMLVTAFPITAATMVLGGIGYVAVGGSDFQISYAIKVIFIGIASMTYPHVLVIAIANRIGVIPHPPAKRTEVQSIWIDPSCPPPAGRGL